MTIIVVTSDRAVMKAFAAAERSRTYTVEYVEPGATREAVSRAVATPDAFLYLDVTGLEPRTLKRRLTRLRTELPYRFGVLDPGSQVRDVAEVFHSAGSDYVAGPLLDGGLSTARLRRVVEYKPVALTPDPPEHVPEHVNHRVIPSGADWSGVRDGREYTFVMLYVGMDHADGTGQELSESQHRGLRRSFAAMLESAFAEHHARVWMWKEDEGLLLMPFEGGRIDAFVAAVRLMLNRVPVNVDEFAQYGALSWRMAMHLGNTTYRASGRTGSIVSESVNFVFHLGSQFVERGGLAVTEPCHRFVPEGLRPLLNHRGEFESIHVYTLRDLIE